MSRRALEANVDERHAAVDREREPQVRRAGAELVAGVVVVATNAPLPASEKR